MKDYDVRCCSSEFWAFLTICVVPVAFAGINSGLPLGLLSFGPVDLEVLLKFGQPQERKYAGDRAGQAGRGDRRRGRGERDEILQEVLERMLVRIAVAVLVPAAAGIGQMHVFGVVKQSGIWDVPVWVVVPTTFSCLAASALGVAYGGLSTIWDPKRTGSLLGLEEAQKNWADLWQDKPNDA